MLALGPPLVCSSDFALARVCAENHQSGLLGDVQLRLRTQLSKAVNPKISTVLTYLPAKDYVFTVKRMVGISIGVGFGQV